MEGSQGDGSQVTPQLPRGWKWQTGVQNKMGGLSPSVTAWLPLAAWVELGPGSWVRALAPHHPRVPAPRSGWGTQEGLTQPQHPLLPLQVPSPILDMKLSPKRVSPPSCFFPKQPRDRAQRAAGPQPLCLGPWGLHI